jgi:hypothetical protein
MTKQHKNAQGLPEALYLVRVVCNKCGKPLELRGRVLGGWQSFGPTVAEWPPEILEQVTLIVLRDVPACTHGLVATPKEITDAVRRAVEKQKTVILRARH